jgi:putative MATE family efflux protein
MIAERGTFTDGDAEDTGYDKTESMGRNPITKELMRFSVPAIIAAETAAGYNLFDAIWCGRLGPEQLAALTVAGPLMTIYRAIGSGIGVGTASLIARNLGAGKREETNRTAGCSITFFFIVSLLATIICLTFLEPLLRLFGANDSVLPFAKDYMFVETLSIAVDFFLVILVELVRVGGSPSIASGGMVVASIADLIWSPILVFGIGPFPALGMAGAALGTTIGRGLGVSVLLAYIGLGKSIYKFKPSYFIPNLRTIVDIYSVGLSQTVRAGAASIAQTIASRTAAFYGVVALGVLGVLYKVNSVVFGFCQGISQGVVPLTGYNFAADKKERVGEVIIKAGLLSFGWGVLCWVVATLFSTQILSLFGTEPAFFAMGALALPIFAFRYFMVGVQTNISAFFQGIGKSISALVIASSRQLIFLIPCLLIMPDIFGLTGLWLAFPVADTFALVLSIAWTAITFRSLKIPFSLRSKPPANT